MSSFGQKQTLNNLGSTPILRARICGNSELPSMPPWCNVFIARGAGT